MTAKEENNFLYLTNYMESFRAINSFSHAFLKGIYLSEKRITEMIKNNITIQYNSIISENILNLMEK
jgi:hypothetical protein